ncbi:MAG: DsrE family protein [Geobacteraceae bacterium]|nr:DsrE family protein [Geobacteraceae bacterium]
MLKRIMVLGVLLLLACSPILHAGQKADDREALAGLKTARVIFDVRVPELEKLDFNLRNFNETFDGIVAQGVKPEMIVVFRGPGVRLLTAAALDEEARDLFRELKRKGVRFEACAVAMRIFKADPAGLIPEVKLVANVFNSLIGYQNKGYATIAIN